MSWDGLFYTIDWEKRGNMSCDFWEKYLDDKGIVKSEYQEWILEIDAFGDRLVEHWDVAEEANAFYERLREELSQGCKESLDFIISRLFSHSFCQYWKNFEAEPEPEGDWLAEIDFSACLSQQEIRVVLAKWSIERKEEIQKSSLRLEAPRFIFSAEDFLFYLEAWLNLLQEVLERPGWGLLWAVSA
ncbi:hypothetical protein [Anaerocolumna chitinilytica]|uniref:Uncharacterized protein n=1 Tax=Anaerocolumna chitinilytica TaxID=1727145 RepID=A0A7I8DPV1_9FIRM|nr:hypothetical protein [Anaerocolumna chitinilytica]BCJ99105.1 hypothetical protein bsdcttw_21460 [Anaerocolumna chitinilytica]